MEAVVLSKQYQIVIPHYARKKLGLNPGIKMQVVSLKDHIELIPIRSIPTMRGFLKGIDSSFEREQEDRM